MNVYKFTYKSHYGGGCAIVCANSKEEAFGVLSDYDEFTEDYTDLNRCEEIHSLSCNLVTSEPYVVCSHFYAE